MVAKYDVVSTVYSQSGADLPADWVPVPLAVGATGTGNGNFKCQLELDKTPSRRTLAGLRL
jgi:hypothetical protein